MPAPNGPRQSVSTGRNRRTVQNIASKGGNIYTALRRDRVTGLGGQLNQGPKPPVDKKAQTFTPTESLKRMQAIKAKASTNLNTTPYQLPKVATSPTQDATATYINAMQGNANMTAMAMLAAASRRNGGRTAQGGAPQGQASGHLQQLAMRLAAKRYGWDSARQWKALQELVQRESSWNPKADNPTSTAYGLFQFLDSTRENYGLSINASPRKQILAGLQYIQDRYGGPRKALNFHTRNNWY